MSSVFTKGDLEKLKAKHNIRTRAGQQDPRTDGPLSAIGKFIPGEAVSFFLGSFSLLEEAQPTTPVGWIGGIVFIVCFVAAIIIAYFKNSEEFKFPDRSDSFRSPGRGIKVTITAVAFIIWALNIEGFITIVRGTVPAYDPIIGGMILLGYTIFVPLIYAEISKP